MLPSSLSSPNRQAAPRALVLVVEDNERNARLTVTMLAAGGYQTRVAADGIEGCQLATELQPSLVITDLQMPRLDGLAMTRLLKLDSRTCAIPVIAISAHALNEHRDAAIEAGCLQFLAKPLRLRDLLNEVNNVLGCQLDA